jgi:protoporphyrinogen oxidase
LVDFLDLAAGLPAGVRAARRRLRYNTVWNLNLGIDRADVTDKHWIYYPEKKYPFYRVGCSSNFSRELAPAGQSSLYVEVSRPGGTRVDVKKMEAAILKSLKQVGLLRRGDELTAREWMPIKVGYVVYDFNRTRAVDQIFNYLATVSTESIGRYGGWKYSFMEETILDGKRCAQRLMGQPDETPTASTGELRPLK